MKNEKQLIVAVDVDGTLLNTEFDDVLARREVDALKAVRAAGHVLALCTGRNLRSVQGLLEQSDWFPDDLPMVLLNGATVWGGRPRRCLANRELAADDILTLIRLFRQYDVVPMVYGADETGGLLHHEKRPVNDILGQYLDKRSDSVGAIEVVDDLLDDPPPVALEVGSIDRKEPILALSEAIRRQMGDRVKVINTRSLLGGGLFYWAEVFHTSCGKDEGLKVLRQEYFEAAGPLVAIGDNYNDLDMFAAADFSVAMGNSPSEVREQAHLVTHSVDEGGAAVVLHQLAQGIYPPRIEV